MNKLLKAGCRRLLKNRLYHIGLLFSAGISIYAVVMRYMDIRKYPDLYEVFGPDYKAVDGFAFSLPIYVVFALTVVAVMFLGTEYSDGTVRNKIVVGHKRPCIYLSNYLICALAGLSMLLVNIAAAFVMGRLLSMEFCLTTEKILIKCVGESMIILGFTALLVLIAMLIQSKAGAAVTALLLTMLLFALAMTISNALLQPEYKKQQIVTVLTDDEGNPYHKVDTLQSEKNPKYLEGTKRAVYEQLDSLLPLNQIMRLSDDRADNPGVMELYSLLTVVILGGIGMIFFENKDLK